MKSPRDERQARRNFLKQMAAGSVAAIMAGEPRLLSAAPDSADKIVHPPAKADACILLWMAGGMAAPDTWDPKALRAVQSGRAD